MGFICLSRSCSHEDTTDRDTMNEPPDNILSEFGIELIAPLSGRLNQHWLVQRQAKPCVLRRWGGTLDDANYELRLLRELAMLGWPVACAVSDLMEVSGSIWSLASFVPGPPFPDKYSLAEQRKRGQLLADLHSDLQSLTGFGQRGTWRRCEEILGDSALDGILANQEHQRSEEVRILRWHLDQARHRLSDIPINSESGTIIHGDFTPWNLLFVNGELT